MLGRQSKKPGWNILKINSAQKQPIHQVQDKYKNIPKEYLKIAESMEAQYINHMLAELDKTIIQENPDTAAQKYYKSLVQSERAQIMAKSENGIGIKDLILDQIYPQHMRRPINNKHAINQYQQNLSNKEVANE